MAIYEYKTHITYQDINENNELSDRGLLNILSQAAGVHSESVGYGLNEVEKTACSWMLLYWKLRILERPCWNSKIIVKTWPREFAKISSWRDFEVYDKDGNMIAIATTEWVLIDAKKQSIGRITEKMIEDYGVVQKSVFEENLSGKLKPEENMEKIYEYTAKRRDIDVNHHVNNANYLEFAYDAFPENVSVNFNNIEIYYKKQIKLGETISCHYSKDGDTHTVCIKSQDEKNLHAVLRFF